MAVTVSFKPSFASLVSFRLTHTDASVAGHPNDRSLTMVDLFCCTGAITGQVPAVGSEVLSRVIVSGREVLTRE
ncbi:hypothetical protein L7405_003042 [Escherichia coli]|nr:hypothetical protein [Escherichia coli]